MSGKTELIKLDTLLHICEGFGVTLEEFFTEPMFDTAEQDEQKSRNSQLRQICGLKPKFFKQEDGTYKMHIVPSEAAYSRFLANLLKCKKEMKETFEELVEYMYSNLEGFGEDLAGDGKAIESYARTNGKKAKKGDRRKDEEANWGVKNIQKV